MPRFASFTEVGPRQSNEDRLLLPIERDGRVLLAIADGVGGAAGGELAAEIVIGTLSELFSGDAELPILFAEAVKRMQAASSQDGRYAKMATTLSAATLKGDELSVCHVGDTRVYHLRDGGLETLSQDQTELAELVRKGILSRRQAEKYSRKNVLLYALSPQNEYEIYSSSAKVRERDRVLLVSDGVYTRVHKMQIAELSKNETDLDGFLSKLREMVIASGPRDNFTALAYEI